MSAARSPTKVAASPARRRGWRLALLLFFLLLGAFGLFVIRPFWRLASQFDDLTYRQPSRLYSRSAVVQAGRSYPADLLIESLRNEGYREADPGSLPAGRYRKTRSGLAVHLRSFLLPAPGGSAEHGGVMEIGYQGSTISRLLLDGAPTKSVALEPALIASYFGPDQQERRPVTLDRVSEDLVNAVIAAEDDRFFEHSGVSVTGIARAFWVNMRGGEIRQGGSTLTQQLVKNIYLSHERTLGRKAQELVLALMLEARYGKRQILEAYLNSIYLGGSGGVSLMGMGAASRAYFGKDPSQVDLAEAATLAGMIRAPAVYSPATHPEKSKERRDWVLGRIALLGRVPRERIDQALAEPLSVAPEPVVRRRAPYFADAMAAEAQRRYGIESLADAGYILFSTLDLQGQKAAGEAVGWGLNRAEERNQEGRQKGQAAKGPLQAALVSVAPDTGGILAYIGGKSYDESQFDRAGQALRQAGSAFKPIVYAAAFETGSASPSSFLEDSPLSVRLATMTWSPKNDDGTFHGWVSVRTALEKSYNPATARLALQVGMPKIVALARKMGVTAEMDPFPSVALGAVDLTPVELATVYATLAAGGVRPPVHGLVAVLDRQGKALQAAPLPKPERVLSPQSAYMVTSLLQGVLVRGTARGAAYGIPGDVAGKTGTTNKQRDSWFGGFGRERATVVWVGYDDNARTRLSGARAALPIWVRFTAKVAPRGGYSMFQQPPGLTTASIDPTSGMLATEFCPAILTEVFRQGEVPTQTCDRHLSRTDQDEYAQSTSADESAEEDQGLGDLETIQSRSEEPRKRHPFRSWLKRVFGSDEKDGKAENNEKGEKAEKDPDGEGARGRDERKPPG